MSIAIISLLTDVSLFALFGLVLALLLVCWALWFRAAYDYVRPVLAWKVEGRLVIGFQERRAGVMYAYSFSHGTVSP